MRTERARGIFTGGLDAQRIDVVTKYITEHTAPDEPVFVVPWAAGFYFLANRANPTRTDFMLFEDPEVYPCLLARLDERPPSVRDLRIHVGRRRQAFPRLRGADRSLHPIAIRDRIQHRRLRDLEAAGRGAPQAAGVFPRACQPRRFRFSDLCLARYRAGHNLRLSLTLFTPSVALAIETAFAFAAADLTVPFSVTTLFFTSMSMSLSSSTVFQSAMYCA